MKSSAVLTQNKASTTQIKVALQNMNRNLQSKVENLVQDTSIAQLMGGDNDNYILPEYRQEY
jgi:hypothetical protein